MNAPSRSLIGFGLAGCLIVAAGTANSYTVKREAREGEPAVWTVESVFANPDKCLRIDIAGRSTTTVSAAVIPPRPDRGVYISHSSDHTASIVIPSPEAGNYVVSVAVAPDPHWRAVAITTARHPLASIECADPTPPCWPHSGTCPTPEAHP